MQPEQAIGPVSERDAAMMRVGSAETVKETPSAIARLKDMKQRLERLLEDPVLREGTEASLRTAINAMIAVADTIPGAGSLASWGADAAKIWARTQYFRERQRVAAEGGDPSKVRLSKVDLTPDVSIRLAVGTELLEFAGADFFPTHAIEAVAQLRHDLPRIRKALARFRELTAREAAVPAEVKDAAATFDVTIE